MALALRRDDGDQRQRAAATPSAPRLTVVPRRRRAAGFAVTLSFLVAVLMLGAAVLHTQLAERQFRIDRLERSVANEQDRFDVLRRQRAELRSPNRLATEARALGLSPASVTEFVPVDGIDAARAIAAAGRTVGRARTVEADGPLDQFRLVKSVANEVP